MLLLLVQGIPMKCWPLSYIVPQKGLFINYITQLQEGEGKCCGDQNTGLARYSNGLSGLNQSNR